MLATPPFYGTKKMCFITYIHHDDSVGPRSRASAQLGSSTPQRLRLWLERLDLGNLWGDFKEHYKEFIIQGIDRGFKGFLRNLRDFGDLRKK